MSDTENKVVSIEDFFTREKANEGIKVPLLFPNQEPSGKHLIIRGADSDHFHKAVAIKHRRIARELAAIEAKVAVMPDKEKDEFREKLLENFHEDDLEIEIDQLCVLVAGWDLETPFTQENLRNLLRESPQVRMLIDTTAARRSTFFKAR